LHLCFLSPCICFMLFEYFRIVELTSSIKHTHTTHNTQTHTIMEYLIILKRTFSRYTSPGRPAAWQPWQNFMKRKYFLKKFKAAARSDIRVINGSWLAGLHVILVRKKNKNYISWQPWHVSWWQPCQHWQPVMPGHLAGLGMFRKDISNTQNGRYIYG